MNQIDTLKVIVEKSLTENLELSQTTEIFKTILTEQHETYELITYIWIALTGILISGTLFWNFFLSNKKISHEIKKNRNEIDEEINRKFQEYISSHNLKFKKLKENNDKFLDDKISKIEADVSSKVDDTLTKNKREFDRIWGDIHRSFHELAKSNNEHANAVERIFHAMMHYNSAGGHEDMIGEMTKDLEELLLKEAVIEDIIKDDEFALDLYLESIELLIPSYLNREKKNIIKALTKCK